MTASDFDGLRDRIHTHLVEAGIPSVAVAVAKAGEILWEEGIGWANREDRIPATAHTPYSLASISKPITATGLMILVEQGMVDLDRPVNEYLGDAKVLARIGNAEEATVRRVANHSAGLPLHYHFFYEDEPYEPPPMDETIRRYGNLVTPPGERYQYCNLGYGILDYVVSRCSGRSFSDFMQQEVFIPLDMPRAAIGVEGLEAHHAVRYRQTGSLIPFYEFDHPGASAFYCSAHDLVRFGMFHLKAHLPDQKQILSDEAIDAMKTPTMKIPGSVGYGVGWRTLDLYGVRVISHSGGMGGVRTFLALIPEEDIAVAVLCNGETDRLMKIFRDVVSVVLPEAAEEDPKEETAEELTFGPEEELLGDWHGQIATHSGDLPFVLKFQPDGDVHARIGHQFETLVNDCRFSSGSFTGRMTGNVGTDDASKYPYHLGIDLMLRESVLNGSVTAMGTPADRSGFALNSWAELSKT